MLKKAAIVAGAAAAAAFALAPMASAQDDTDNYVSYGNTIDCSNTNATTGGTSALAPVQTLTNAAGGILTGSQGAYGSQVGSLLSPQNTHCNAGPVN
jgi:hypothetical protein